MLASYPSISSRDGCPKKESIEAYLPKKKRVPFPGETTFLESSSTAVSPVSDPHGRKLMPPRHYSRIECSPLAPPTEAELSGCSDGVIDLRGIVY